MRTKQQIETEIKALKALKPVGTFKAKTARSIQLAIEELVHGYDDTAEEWNELTDEQRDIINCTRRWKEGDADDKTSKGWGALVSLKLTSPVRIQLSRKAGFNLQKKSLELNGLSCVVVSRPTRWGNPFVVGRDGSRATCVGCYEKLMAGYLCLSVKATPAAQNEAHIHAAQHLGELRGKNLACWCPANSACHADVLLRLAQRIGAQITNQKTP